MLSLAATAGVIFLGVLDGILVAIALSILLFFHRNWWPYGAVLGRVPGREGWHSDARGERLVEDPGIVVFRWEAPLFFANAGIFSQQVRELVQERKPTWVILQCEAITDIDVTAAGMLERLDNELNAQGVHLAFVEMRSRLHDLVRDYGLHKTLDADHFYGSIEEALADIAATPGDGLSRPTLRRASSRGCVRCVVLSRRPTRSRRGWAPVGWSGRRRSLMSCSSTPVGRRHTPRRQGPTDRRPC